MNEGIISNVIRARGAANKENKVSEYEEEFQRTWQAPSSLNCGMVLLTHNC
jgi:hypothetical protein